MGEIFTPADVDENLLKCALRACLKTLRKNAKISQERLANDAGLNRSHVWGMEAGEKSLPTIKTLYKMLPPLGIDFVEFAQTFETAMKRCRRGKAVRQT